MYNGAAKLSFSTSIATQGAQKMEPLSTSATVAIVVVAVKIKPEFVQVTLYLTGSVKCPMSVFCWAVAHKFQLEVNE